jgi:hypothetical protein
MGFGFLGGDTSGTGSLPLVISPGSIPAQAVQAFFVQGYFTAGGTVPGTPTVVYNYNGLHINAIATPKSPASSNASGCMWIFYILNAPAGTSGVNWTLNSSGGSADFVINLFMASSFSATGTVLFDTDASNVQTTNAPTPITVPTIVPTYQNSLLYGSAFLTNGNDSSAGGNPILPWVRSNDYTGEDTADFYILNASAPQAAGWPDTNNPDIWASMIASFYIQGSPLVGSGIPIQGYGATVQDDMHWLGGDNE